MNPKLKLVKNILEKRSVRRKEKAFVVEGPRLVEEAGDRVKFFFYCENLPLVKKLEEQGSIGYKISRQQFEEISQVEAPQGILAVVRQVEHSINEMKEGVIVFCIGVQDPGNLGTIIRSADAFGAAGVILSKGTVDLYNPKVVRSTMGSLFHMPIITVEDEMETIEQLKRRNVKIIATDAAAKNKVFEADLKGPIAVLVGNEGAGVPVNVIGLADETVYIPMPGKAESLNVGVSMAIILFEVLRQKFCRDAAECQ